MVAVWRATVVAPALGVGCPDFVVIVRAAEGLVDVVVVEALLEYDCEVEAVEVGDVAAFCMALCARKAERNEPKKGL